MVLPLLGSLLFGIIEFGRMFSVYLQLHNMAREGARAAALGATPAGAIAHLTTAGTLDAEQVDPTLEFRTYVEGAGWSDWQPLESTGSSNNAPVGAQVRAVLAWDYHMVTGRLFSCLADDPATGTKHLRSAVVMCRE